MSAQKPWYYVAGRPDIAEKLIARRREKEDSRHREWSSTASYFNQCDAQSKMFKTWEEQNKVCNGHTKLPSRPPYGVDDEAYRIKLTKDEECRVSQIKSFVKDIKTDIEDLQSKEGELQIDEERLKMCLNVTIDLKKDFEVQTQLWQIRTNNIQSMRVVRSKLRYEVFLILDKLFYARESIQTVLELLKDVLSTKDYEDLRTCSMSALQLLDALIASNRKKNIGFSNLYDEEAIARLQSSEKRFIEDDKMCKEVFTEVLNLMEGTLTSKILKLIESEEKLLNEHNRKVNDLLMHVNGIKHDHVWNVLVNEQF